MHFNRGYRKVALVLSLNVRPPGQLPTACWQPNMRKLWRAHGLAVCWCGWPCCVRWLGMESQPFAR